jgi:putative tricarboxylic transport membrane protein
MTYKMADLITAGILLLLGVLVAADSLRLGGGWGMEGPKPGFFPFLMAAIMIVGSVLVVRKVLNKPGKNALERFVPPEAIKPVLVVLVPACLMILLTEVVGLYVAGMIYLTLYIRWVGDFRWRTALAIGVLTPLTFYYIFEKLFLIPMPAGMYGSMLLRF